MSKHTPGPRQVGSKVKRNVYSSSVATPICVCDSMQEATIEEELANARLIAAAPLMLEALEKLARLGNGDRYGNSIGNEIAIDAIAKAKGETL